MQLQVIPIQDVHFVVFDPLMFLAETLLCDESDHPQKANHLFELQVHILLQLSETYMNSSQLVLAAQVK